LLRKSRGDRSVCRFAAQAAGLDGQRDSVLQNESTNTVNGPLIGGGVAENLNDDGRVPNMINRRGLLSGIAALPFVTAYARGSETRGEGPALAVTIDDFEILDTPKMPALKRHQAILDALEQYKIKACGFPAGKFIDNETSPDHLRSWAAHGHLIGNHTYSHPYYGGANPAGMIADVLRAEPLLSRYSTFTKLFRFPYLSEGKTREGRDRMRDLLHEHGYRNGPVTIDTSDWYINSRLIDRLKNEGAADILPYRKYYLDHLWDRATFYDGLVKRLYGHSVTHTILLHHNLTTAMFLSDALAMFDARGWRLVDAADAFAQPLYAMQPDTVPAGQSLIWSLAKEHGGFEDQLRYPGEDDTYEKPKMDRLLL
jgi:peptidoglycan/xylan/chitin deacetylase (PgdA/CDA1 family)